MVSLIQYGSKQDIQEKTIEGYTHQMSYRKGDTVHFFLNAKQPGIARIYYAQTAYAERLLDSFAIQQYLQPKQVTDASEGCAWQSQYQLVLTSGYLPGYYKVALLSRTDTSYITFLIENREPSNVAVLVPSSTWTAYNRWGGKSLYYNNHENRTVYYVSTHRPNIEYDYTKDGIHIDINIAQFFRQQYNAIILPDYALEYDTALLACADIIVLANHCEYFSEKMYDNLSRLVHQQNKSIVSLGGNQIYWKTKWHHNYTVMECRKDRSFFSFWPADYGGRWREHVGKAEHHLLGVQFTEAGAGTYAPYMVCNTNHWMFSGLNTKAGDLFGQRGMSALPLSGVETDKQVALSEGFLLAKGLNLHTEDAGAHLVIKELNSSQAILSTGSIQSGAGLGYDSTLTFLIRNFIQHYTY